MTTYYTTASGEVINNHDITRAYQQTDGSVPFHEFQTSFLKERGAHKTDMTCDELIKIGQFREAVFLFNERYKCGYERAKNAVYSMKAAMGY